jgi:hypothetical protein
VDVAPGQTLAPPFAGRALAWVRRASSATGWTVVASLLLSGLALLLSTNALAVGAPLSPIFSFLFRRNEPAAAWISAGIVAAAAVLARSPRVPERSVVARLAADPRAFIGVVTLALAAASLLVYRAHPLSMDEYAPLFQARVFARLQVAAQVPPELVPRLIPPYKWFIEASSSGAMLSAYWPGFALLLTPFVWLGCPWLLNPLIGGATLFLVSRLARRLSPASCAPGWAVLLTAASPAFFVNAISFYSMPAHLAASLCFAVLVLEGRLLLAGVVGSVALALHNPFPHTLFALPFIAFVAWQPGRFRNLLRLAAGYLPGTVVLLGGWMWIRDHVTHPIENRQGLLVGLGALRRSAFTAPSLETMGVRTMNLAELASWAVPVLLPLAILGFWKLRSNTGVRLLAASAGLTLAAYAFVTFDQGHGWGFRYFHAAWGTLPLLASCVLEEGSAAPALRRVALCAALGSLILCTPLRLWQVRTFMDAHLGQLPQLRHDGQKHVMFVDIGHGAYTIDLVQNDPFLESDRWTLISFGARNDALFVRAFFPRARQIAAGAFGSVWQVD